MGRQTAIVRRRKYPEIIYILLGQKCDLSTTEIDNLHEKEVGKLMSPQEIKVPLCQD